MYVLSTFILGWGGLYLALTFPNTILWYLAYLGAAGVGWGSSAAFLESLTSLAELDPRLSTFCLSIIPGLMIPGNFVYERIINWVKITFLTSANDKFLGFSDASSQSEKIDPVDPQTIWGNYTLIMFLIFLVVSLGRTYLFKANTEKLIAEEKQKSSSINFERLKGTFLDMRDHIKKIFQVEMVAAISQILFPLGVLYTFFVFIAPNFKEQLVIENVSYQYSSVNGTLDIYADASLDAIIGQTIGDLYSFLSTSSALMIFACLAISYGFNYLTESLKILTVKKLSILYCLISTFLSFGVSMLMACNKYLPTWVLVNILPFFVNLSNYIGFAALTYSGGNLLFKNYEAATFTIVGLGIAVVGACPWLITFINWLVDWEDNQSSTSTTDSVPSLMAVKVNIWTSLGTTLVFGLMHTYICKLKKETDSKNSNASPLQNMDPEDQPLKS